MDHRGANHLFFFLAIGVLLLPWSAGAQGDVDRSLRGFPYFVENYSPDDYDAHHQNWAVVQDERGVVYVANNQGVLEYDGTSWSLIPTANQSTVRALARGSDGRIYVGAVGELGYLAPDSAGRMGYVSLVDELPEEHREFGKDVWGTHATSHGVYFQTYDHIFRWHRNEFTVYSYEDPIHTSFLVRDQLLVRQTDHGLRRLEGDSLVTLEGGEQFANWSIYAVIPFRRDEYILATRNFGLFLWSESGVSEVTSSGSVYARRNLVYHGARVSDSLYAIGTVKGGLALLDDSLETEKVLNTQTGIQSDRVYFVYPDDRGGLWLGLYNGVSRIQTTGEFTRMDGRNGLNTAVQSIARHEGDLYLATIEGLYRSRGDDVSPEGATQFTEVPGFTDGQVWDLLSTKKGLLVAGANGVHVLRDGSSHSFKDGHLGVGLFRTDSDPGRVLVALRYGIGCLSLTEDRWTWSGVVPGIDRAVRSFGDDRDEKLWLGGKTQGVTSIESDLCANDAPTTRTYGPGEGLSRGPSMVVNVDDRPWIVARSGEVYSTARRDSAEGSRRFSLVGRITTTDSDEGTGPAWLEAGRDGALWYGAGSELGRIRLPGPQSDTLLRDFSVRFENTEVLSVYAEKDLVWIGTDQGLIRYRRPREGEADPAPPRALVRRVSVDGDSLVFGGTHGEFAGAPRPDQRASSVPEFAFGANNMRFEYSAPAFRDPSGTQYQYRLVGFDPDWSDWTDQTIKEYTNLPEGDYRFRVRARTVTGTVTQAASYRFTIAPPWYRTWVAYVFYGLLAACLLVLYGHYRSMASRRKLERERVVNERLKEANEELRKANQMKDEFLANISHELRTPLTSILGFADVLAEEVDDSKKEFLQMIKDSGSRLHDTLDAILDLAKFRAGMVELDRSPLDVAAEVEEATRLFLPQAEEKGLELSLRRPESSVTAQLDQFCLERIVSNLVSNAIKFTDEGEVVVVVLADPTTVTIHVRDTGMGIEEEFQPALFDEFRQESVGDTREHAGVGLGLAITHRMVELMEGTIEVESEKGRGSVFTVRFPRQIPVNGDGSGVSENGREEDRENGYPEHHPGGNGVAEEDGRQIYQVEREMYIRLG